MIKTIVGIAAQEYQNPTVAVFQDAPLGLLVPQWHKLIAAAREFSAQNQNALAIVLAAAAGEWAATFALETLLNVSKVSSKAIVELKKRRANPNQMFTWSLESPRIRKAYIELTGEDPEGAPWWTEWTASRRERHEIVHRGKLSADARTAKQCIDAAESYIAHLTNVLQKFAIPTP